MTGKIAAFFALLLIFAAPFWGHANTDESVGHLITS